MIGQFGWLDILGDWAFWVIAHFGWLASAPPFFHKWETNEKTPYGPANVKINVSSCCFWCQWFLVCFVYTGQMEYDNTQEMTFDFILTNLQSQLQLQQRYGYQQATVSALSQKFHPVNRTEQRSSTACASRTQTCQKFHPVKPIEITNFSHTAANAGQKASDMTTISVQMCHTHERQLG